jgi:glutathione S-transferase
MSFSFSPDFGYVILVVGLSHFMNIFLIVQVAKARKKYDVQYPKLYAEGNDKKANEFNSVQR